jgi:hypothetical protein
MEANKGTMILGEKGRIGASVYYGQQIDGSEQCGKYKNIFVRNNRITDCHGMSPLFHNRN